MLKKETLQKPEGLNSRLLLSKSAIMFTFPPAFALGGFLIRYILLNSMNHYSKQPDFKDLEERLTIFSYNLSLLGGSVLVLTLLTLCGRILFGKPFPGEKDVAPVFLLNRIIQNTLEQSLVFIPGYLSLTLNESKSLSCAIFILFLIGRGVYAIGYLLSGLIVIPTLRTPGMFMTLNSSVLLYAKLFGFDLIKFIVA